MSAEKHPGLFCEQCHDSGDAAMKGHLQCLQYFYENTDYAGIPLWNAETTLWAASTGQLAALVYVCEHHCPWHMETTYFAAKNGYKHCLAYAWKQNCPWHPHTTYAAASKGHLDCLQFALEHQCHWDRLTSFSAAINGHLSCLQFIYENCGHQATWEESSLENFEDNDQIPAHIKEYLRNVQEDWKLGRNIVSHVKPAR